MPSVKNRTVYYVQQSSGFIEPHVTVTYVEEEIDLDNVPLDGSILVKVLALSSDPYMRYRMRSEGDTRNVFCP